YKAVDMSYEANLLQARQAAMHARGGATSTHAATGSTVTAAQALTLSQVSLTEAGIVGSGTVYEHVADGADADAEVGPSPSSVFSVPGLGFQGVGSNSLGDFDNPETMDDQSGCTAVVAVIAGSLQQGACSLRARACTLAHADLVNTRERVHPSPVRAPARAGATLTVANAGDSRAVLCRGGTAMDMSVDHKTKRHDERARILAAGGMILRGRVLGRLAVTRALGDLSLKRGADGKELVTGEPEIFETDLVAQDEFLLVACDGIYDVMSSQEAVDFVRSQLATGADPHAAAAALVKQAYDLGSADNLSAIVTLINAPAHTAASFTARRTAVGSAREHAELGTSTGGMYRTGSGKGFEVMSALLEAGTGPARYPVQKQAAVPDCPPPPAGGVAPASSARSAPVPALPVHSLPAAGGSDAEASALSSGRWRQVTLLAAQPASGQPAVTHASVEATVDVSTHANAAGLQTASGSDVRAPAPAPALPPAPVPAPAAPGGGETQFASSAPPPKRARGPNPFARSTRIAAGASVILPGTAPARSGAGGHSSATGEATSGTDGEGSSSAPVQSSVPPAAASLPTHVSAPHHTVDAASPAADVARPPSANRTQVHSGGESAALPQPQLSGARASVSHESLPGATTTTLANPFREDARSNDGALVRSVSNTSSAAADAPALHASVSAPDVIASATAAAHTAPFESPAGDEAAPLPAMQLSTPVKYPSVEIASARSAITSGLSEVSVPARSASAASAADSCTQSVGSSSLSSPIVAEINAFAVDTVNQSPHERLDEALGLRPRAGTASASSTGSGSGGAAGRSSARRRDEQVTPPHSSSAGVGNALPGVLGSEERVSSVDVALASSISPAPPHAAAHGAGVVASLFPLASSQPTSIPTAGRRSAPHRDASPFGAAPSMTQSLTQASSHHEHVPAAAGARRSSLGGGSTGVSAAAATAAAAARSIESCAPAGAMLVDALTVAMTD
ncbi:MAG: protein serine/threonine phosphatase 2C family protein, partial [Methanobacteriota archaeon]